MQVTFEGNPDLIPIWVFIKTLQARIVTLEWEDPDHPALRALKDILADAEKERREGKRYIPNF